MFLKTLEQFYISLRKKTHFLKFLTNTKHFFHTLNFLLLSFFFVDDVNLKQKHKKVNSERVFEPSVGMFFEIVFLAFFTANFTV